MFSPQTPTFSVDSQHFSLLKPAHPLTAVSSKLLIPSVIVGVCPTNGWAINAVCECEHTCGCWSVTRPLYPKLRTLMSSRNVISKQQKLFLFFSAMVYWLLYFFKFMTPLGKVITCSRDSLNLIRKKNMKLARKIINTLHASQRTFVI